MKNTMKKLMIATLGLAVAGSVFGAPQVYDFKASVKHIGLKEVRVSIKGKTGSPFKVYQKYMTSANLKGYLIQDFDGLTSQCLNRSTATTYDAGRNRGFLVVQNSKAAANVRAPKIMPAILDTKWIDTAFTKDRAAKTGLAEGTLFVGGDMVSTVRPKLENVNKTVSELHDDSQCGTAATATAPGAATVGAVAYADYAWTSIYLFGQFNGPNWFVLPTQVPVSPFDKFEVKWDENLPTNLRRGLAEDGDLWPQLNYFHDTWMNGAGIGKWSLTSGVTIGDVCCGLEPNTVAGEKQLVSLSGNLKGGLFLCTENGIKAVKSTGEANLNYQWFDYTWNTGKEGWEDQFNCDRAMPGLSFADSWQNDLWQDGTVEQETTDVIYGSWSIKLNSKFYAAKGGIAKELTTAEMNKIVDRDVDQDGNATMADVPAYAIWGAIKGAALKLKSSATVYDGTEIWKKGSNERFNLPVVTPAFAKHYGLK